MGKILKNILFLRSELEFDSLLSLLQLSINPVNSKYKIIIMDEDDFLELKTIKSFLGSDLDKNKIVDILIIEGKKTLGDQVLIDTLSFSNFIYTDNYFLTTLDLWLLVNKYKIPSIFVSQKFILQTNHTQP